MIAGGLVWGTDYASGSLYGLDLTSGAPRSQFPIPENGSDVNHFASPSAGGGRLFVASGDQVTAFTVAQPPALSGTTASLVSPHNPASAGTVVSLTAAVAPAPDGGTVTFTDGGAPVSGCSGIAMSAANAGLAGCHVALARVGGHNLAVSYSGDAFYAASTSAGLVESVTAAGVGGSSNGGRHAPIISYASISPRRFAAADTATLRLTVSAAGTVSVSITKLHRGREVGHRCTSTAHKGRSCLIRVTLVRLHYHTRAGGRTAFKLTLRQLPPRGYTAVIYATDHEGRRSRTIRIMFTIVHAHR
jgi:hypothetical protein